MFAVSGNYLAMANAVHGLWTEFLNGPLGNLAAQQATGSKFSVNLKTAKELGITIPATILARADDVIE